MSEGPVASPDRLATRGRVLVRAATVYDWAAPAMMFGREAALHRQIVAALSPRDGERLLDIGCGTGTLTAHAAARMEGGEVVGIDASLTMIARARRKRAGPGVRFEAAVAEALPFESASFDGVISSLFFHHVALDLKGRCAAEMVRVLKPGGRAVIADLDRPWSLFGCLYGGGGWLLFRQPEIRENLQGVLPRVLAEAGLTGLRVVYSTLGCIRVWRGCRR